MSFESWSMKKRLTLTFAAILVLAGVLFTVAVVNIGKMREATGWNTHTYKVLDVGQAMLLDMVNIETGLRGFVASGDEKFLEPLKAGEAKFQTDHQEAKRLTSDNAEQQARLDKLMVNHQQFMAVASSLMKLRRDVATGVSTLDELVTSFGAGRDKASMDAFRAGIAEFTGAESKLLEALSNTLEATSTLTSGVLVGGGLVLCVVTVLLGALLVRSVFRQLGGEPTVAAELVGAVARGDLTVRIDVKAGDTTSLISRLASMRDALATVVGGVRGNSESVAMASAQISQATMT